MDPHLHIIEGDIIIWTVLLSMTLVYCMALLKWNCFPHLWLYTIELTVVQGDNTVVYIHCSETFKDQKNKAVVDILVKEVRAANPSFQAADIRGNH